MRHDVIWTSASLESSEDCVIHEQPAGVALSSSTTLPLDDGLGRIDYELEADADWRVLGATITVSGRTDRRIEIERSSAGWTVDGEPRPDLDACVDLDLGWTPATNILPLRRRPVAIGESVSTRAAWVRFPEFDVVEIARGLRAGERCLAIDIFEGIRRNLEEDRRIFVGALIRRLAKQV